MSQVLGRNITVSVFITDGFYPMLCAKSAELVMNQDEYETTTINSGSSREYETGMDDSTVTISGVTTINNSGGTISAIYLMQQRKQIHRIQFLLEDISGNTRALEFNAIIRRVSISKDRNSFSQSGVDFRVTGVINFDATIPPVIVNYNIWGDTWSTVNGNTFISGASLGTSPSATENGGAFTLTTGDTVLEVDVEGTEFDLVTGSPGGRQAQPAVSTGKINFLNAFDGTEKVFVLFRRPI